eukprot:PhF_6_TR22235/c0_g1_i1/m.31401/K13667/RUMI, KTELC1; protein glucosyltransferase
MISRWVRTILSPRKTMHFGKKRLDEGLKRNLAHWNKEKITLDHHVNMNTCSYRTRMRYNPHGLWLHISKNNVTILRMQVEVYGRTRRIYEYIRQVVMTGPPLPAVVVYVTVNDIPCNPMLPYLTFFGQESKSFGLMIPDDTFTRWDIDRKRCFEAAEKNKFWNRTHDVYFRGSPTHPDRQIVRDRMSTAFPNFTNIQLHVYEKFRSLSESLEENAKHRFVVAVRGRAAASRDKYLHTMGCIVLWASHTQEGRWVQFYHSLWEARRTFLPLNIDNVSCDVQWLVPNATLRSTNFGLRLEKMALRSERMMRFLDSNVTAEYLRNVLRGYSKNQKYSVPHNPIDFMKRFWIFLKKRYKNAFVHPDTRSINYKPFFSDWVARRINQMVACLQPGAQGVLTNETCNY